MNSNKQSMWMDPVVDIREVSDEAILEEADYRGLHLGVTEKQLNVLIHATCEEDWELVRKLVAKLAYYNLGYVI